LWAGGIFGVASRVAVVAGPIALAAADMFTLVLYLNLARWLL
jgi:hypothetical protein